jgi:site-specific recombinase XerC
MKNVAIANQSSPLPAVTPLEERDRALAALARDHGLSAAAIARLDVDSVDLDADVVRVVRADGAVRELPVTPATLRPVARYLEHARDVLAAGGAGGVGGDSLEPRALFLSKTGQRMTGSDVRRRVASLYTRIESARVRAAYLRSHPRA